MTPRKALGKGLDALIPSGGEHGELVYIELEKIQPSPSQPREDFDPKALKELADSIKSQGILQPLLVRKLPDDDSYQLIAGERRFRAAKLAGLKKVPALIKEVDEQQALALSLIENLQRKDLNPIEEAKAYRKLIEDFKLTQEELAELLGKDRSTIANTMRLLKLPREIQAEIEKGRLSAGHARALLSLDSSAKIKMLFQKIIRQGLSVRQAEALAQKLLSEKKKKPKKLQVEIFTREIEQKLATLLGAKVRVLARSKGSGKIEIHFKNPDELERIIGFICKR